MATTYRHIGKRMPRKDARDIVTGRAKYINDLKFEHMLFGKVLRSPHPHANIKSIDTTKAEALKGVKAVLTYKNLPGDWKAGLPPSVPVLDKKVRFVGDAVALVAATTEEIAEKACELIKVEYEPLRAAYDVDDAISSDAVPLYSQFPNNTLPPGCPQFGPKALSGVIMGDTEKGFREADFITEGTYAFENIPNPNPPEPPGAIVKWTGPKSLTVWTVGHHAYMIRWKMQPRLDFADVRAIVGPTGGSYGSKCVSTQVILYAAALAKVTHKPVKIYYSKKEHLNTFVLRFGSRIRGKVGIKKDGTVTAMEGEWRVNTGAWSEITQGQVAVGCGEVQLMMRCKNWNLKSKVVVSNRSAGGIIRGFGGQELKSAFLPILTLAMEKANLDPVQFFKKNFVHPGDGYFWRDGNWYVYRGPAFDKAIEQGAETFGWNSKWKGWLKPTSVNGTKRRGVGVGVHGNADVGEDNSEAWVQVRHDGSAVVFTPISEPGIGQRSSVCKMVAEVLNLPFDKVNVSPPDTAANPFDKGLSGSRGTWTVGSAVIEAAEDALKKLFRRAAPKLDAKPDDLVTQDGKIWSKQNPEKKLPWIAILGLGETVLGTGQFIQDFTLTNFIIIFTEVEVDTETGKLDLVRVCASTDLGQVIDPASVENQIHGGIGSAGIDAAIFEESVLDPSTGRILSGNMIDTKWRTFVELPEYQKVILETPFPSHRFKAMGMGEITTAPGPSAILMAVSSAIGKRIFEYPVTPDKILTALGKIKGGKA